VWISCERPAPACSGSTGQAATLATVAGTDASSHLMALGATGGRPAVELLLAPEDERIPLPLGVDDAYGFDDGLPRVGWVALKIGYQVVALTDGDLLHPVALPEAWQIFPAADPSLVLLRRYFERPFRHAELQTVELCDAHGRTLRSTQVEGGIVGELRSGWLVTYDALVSWEGDRRPLPAPGSPNAVLSGRWLLMLNAGMPFLVDAEGDPQPDAPSEGRRLLSETYDAIASRVAFRQWNEPWILVAADTGLVARYEIGFSQHSAVWLDQDRLLVVGERRRGILDVHAGRLSAVDGLPRGAYPRVDVTGRFDPEQLRAVLRPPWRGAIPADTRADLQRRSEERVREAAAAAGLAAALERARPAIRLRSCLPPKTIPVGASRLGGRPDIPRRHAWPTYEGEPMAFLAQLRCDELAAALPERSLPTEGLLLVFAAIDPDGGFPAADEAVHVEVVPEEGLSRRAWPKALAEELRYGSALAVAEPMHSVPDRAELTGLADEDVVERFIEAIRPSGPWHQVFGHPSTIEGVRPFEGRELLLQVDADALVGAEFGDGGRLYVWCPEEAALAGTIDGCLVDMDSH